MAKFWVRVHTFLLEFGFSEGTQFIKETLLSSANYDTFHFSPARWRSMLQWHMSISFCWWISLFQMRNSPETCSSARTLSVKSSTEESPPDSVQRQTPRVPKLKRIRSLKKRTTGQENCSIDCPDSTQFCWPKKRQVSSITRNKGVCEEREACSWWRKVSTHKRMCDVS